MTDQPNAEKLRLIVTATADPGEDIRELRLARADGAPLPAFSPGAHIRVDLGDGRSNAYSLIDLNSRAASPNEYVIAVRRDDNGAGGSRRMHEFARESEITCSLPKNDFPLDSTEHPAILLAGGIGITPILSMATALGRTGRDWRLIYAARSDAAAAYAEALTALHGARIAHHRDDAAGGPLAVDALVSGLDPQTHIYVCGPRPMIDAVRCAADAAGFAPEQIHTELFDAPAPSSADQPFEVEIASTGAVIQVAADQTIIEALEAAGMDVMYDCQRGDCGICQTTVLDGTPDHRDVVLSEAERASGDVMQICVSRALTPRLKLDL